MARPKLKIDEAKVAELAYGGASNCEIAAILDCDEGTIRKRFFRVLAKSRAERRIWLRSIQNKAAEDGQPTMLVWLGKNELGQTDKAEPTITKVIVQYADRRIDGHAD